MGPGRAVQRLSPVVNAPGVPGGRFAPVPQDKFPTLPRGHHRLSRDEVGAAQRTRLLLAVVEVVAERGYAGATVGDVLRRARISRQTFYENFSNKEDCFLAAFD